MYDPTIFDNLKVAIENHIYDLDNKEREVDITDRLDTIELSSMSRRFVLQFTLASQPEVRGEVVLEASVEDLSAEILERSMEDKGCTISVRFYKKVDNVTKQCKEIEKKLEEIWQINRPVTQTLSFIYGKESTVYMNTILIFFNHKINEDHMDDIPELVDHVIETLGELNQL